jgi:hypothetical protein
MEIKEKKSELPMPAAIAIAVLVIAVCVWSFLTNPLEHIEDTNGPDNFALTTITDENIINLDTGALGGPNKSKGLITGDAIEFSADKFTGVTEILYDNYWGPSDFVLDMTNYEIHGGNFRMVVVRDGKIVAELEPGMFVEYRLEDVTGTVSLRIAGESAAFKFYINQTDYDMHSHND